MASRKLARKSDAAPARLVEVAVFAAIRHPLTYAVPNSTEARAGQRVGVPLGARHATGVVLGPSPDVAPGIKIREILRVLDVEPALTPELLDLGGWIAEYYLAPLGEVFHAMLPLLPETRRARKVDLTEAGRRRLDRLVASLLPDERGSGEAELLRYAAVHSAVTYETLRRKFSEGLLRDALDHGHIMVRETQVGRARRKIIGVRLAGPVPSSLPRPSPVARRILEALEQQGTVEDHRELLKASGGALAHLRTLKEQGRIEFFQPSREAGPDAPWPESVVALSEAQAAALKDLTARLDERRFNVALLHGVTASGKTEVYLRLMAHCLGRGQSALMMVPEIALTPAVQSQFQSRFGDAVAVLHSGLGEAERHDAWWRVRRGQARVVLGTRSAVFAPLRDLGLVIVDEEHEGSYKQEETPRYHGRDVAVVRARLSGALAVLGSATPSLESYLNAQKGKYQLLTLPDRVAGRPLAQVEIIDMREEFRETHTQVPISRRLREEIEAQLRAGAQTMILLNRRGYSWFLLCRSCGQTERCVNCSISLTYHRRPTALVCHYCGYTASIPARCGACGSEYLYYVGEGTEKLELKLSEFFPGARVARLDRDVARRPSHFRKVLDEFRSGKIQILVGTQLIAKGHDFPGVTLVGVVSADTMLSLPDFRAAEKTFQLLTQAAGRSGRGEAPGRVLVQTFYPEHYAIRFAATQDYEGFFAKEIGFRRLMHYPPSAALANVIVQDKELERAAQVARQVGDFLEGQKSVQSGLRILGPSPAPLAKVKGLYRIQFLLKSNSRAQVHRVLRSLAEENDRRGIPPGSVMIDADPLSLM